MSRFAKKAGFDIAPYTPGEQPKGREYVKLNTNESPFPPSPAVIRAIEGGEASRLNLYSDPTASDLNRAIAQRFSAVLGKEGKPPVSPRSFPATARTRCWHLPSARSARAASARRSQ